MLLSGCLGGAELVAGMVELGALPFCSVLFPEDTVVLLWYRGTVVVSGTCVLLLMSVVVLTPDVVELPVLAEHSLLTNTAVKHQRHISSKPCFQWIILQVTSTGRLIHWLQSGCEGDF